MSLFEQPIESMIGGLQIDLVSAPIEPGVHELHVDVGIGGVEVYVPSYVKLSVEGRAVIGGYDVHEGLGLIEGAHQRVRRLLRLSNQIPHNAVPAPEQPVAIKIVIDGGIGGIDIYRLPPTAA